MLTTFESLVAEGALELSDGYRTKRSELGRPGVPILRVAEVFDGRIAPSYKDHVSEELRRAFQWKTTRSDDVILTTKGTVGRVARVGRGLPEFVYSPQLCFFRVVDRRRLDPGWLYNWFKGNEFRTQALRVQDQTDMAAYINLVDLRHIHITVPPLTEQRAIAEVLGALDDKIEANRTKVSLSYEVLQSTWQLTAKETTETVSVGDISDLDKGLSYKGAGLGSGAPLVNLGNFGVDGLFHCDALKRYSGESRERHWVQDGDLVLANTDLTQRREILGQPALVDTGEKRALFSHHVYAVRDRTEERDPGLLIWLYAALREDSFRDRAVTYATGTTVAALPRDAVLTYEVPWPAAAERHSWASMAQDLVTEASHTSKESSALAAIRDALLPPLLSGELRVHNAVALVEGVV